MYNELLILNCLNIVYIQGIAQYDYKYDEVMHSIAALRTTTTSKSDGLNSPTSDPTYPTTWNSNSNSTPVNYGKPPKFLEYDASNNSLNLTPDNYYTPPRFLEYDAWNNSQNSTPADYYAPPRPMDYDAWNNYSLNSTPPYFVTSPRFPINTSINPRNATPAMYHPPPRYHQYDAWNNSLNSTPAPYSPPPRFLEYDTSIDVTTNFTIDEGNNTTVPPTVSNSTTNSTSKSTSKYHAPYKFNALKHELQAVKTSMHSGYFTASFIVLLNIIMQKENEHVEKLIEALNYEVRWLNSQNQLDILGDVPKTVLQMMTQMMDDMPEDVLNQNIGIVKSFLVDRHEYFVADANEVLDGIDAAYCLKADLDDIVQVLVDCKYFPYNNVSDTDIAKRAIDTFIMKPFNGIKGSILGDSLLQKLTDSLLNQFGPGILEIPHDRRYNVGLRRNFLDRIITKIINYLTLPPTTRKSTLPDINSVYLKNERLRNSLKKRMKQYQERKHENIEIDKKLKSRRGLTTKTTIFTTVKVPPMWKSKYYVMKYVKKNLYKMTTRPSKITRNPWLFYTKKEETTKKNRKKQRYV